MKHTTKIHHLLSILLVAVAALGAYGLWRMNTPYPYPTNWDIWEHQTIITIINNEKWALYPSQLSDTFRFDGYTTLFHTVTAFIQKITHADILGFWWIAEGVFTILMAIASYFLTFIVTRDRKTAVFAGILSSFFFESTVVFTPLFLMPQTAAALLWTVGLMVLMSRLTDAQKAWILCPLMILMVFTHMIIGLVGIAFYGAILLFNRMTILKQRVWFISLLIILPVITYSICTVVAHVIPLNQINFGEASAYMQGIWEKLLEARVWYGFLPIIFLPIGLLTTKNRSLSIVYVMMLGLVCSQIPYALKFYTLGRFMTLIFTAAGISWTLSFIRTGWMRWMTTGFIGIAVVFIFLTNIAAWKTSIEFRGIASQISPNERTAAQILKDKNIDTNAYLVSDPATQTIMEVLTGIDSQGGAYMNETSRKTLAQLFSSGSPGEFRERLFSITDTVTTRKPTSILLIISARTCKWLTQPSKNQYSLSFNIWRPDGLTLHDLTKIDAWEKQFQLTKLYENTVLVTYEVSRKDSL